MPIVGSMHPRLKKRIDNCVSCGTKLPLRLPKAGESGANWQCVCCGYRYFGLLDQEAEQATVPNVRLMEQVDNAVDRMKSKLDISRLVETGDPTNGPEFKRQRRRSPRHFLDSTVLARPVDAAFQPTGEAFLARSKDISSEGMCLLHTEPLEAGLLGIDLLTATGNVVHVVIRILHCRTSGSLYEIGGEFVTRLD